MLRSELAKFKYRHHLLIWPSLYIAGIVFLLVAALAIPRSHLLVLVIGIPLIAVVSLLPIGLACIRTIEAMRSRRFWRAFTAFLLPLFFTMAVIYFPATLRACAAASDFVQFYVGYPFLAHAVSKLPKSAGPRLAVFAMDGFVSMSNGLAFDESDELKRPAGQQSAAWKARVIHTELQSGDWTAEGITGHYYRWWSD